MFLTDERTGEKTTLEAEDIVIFSSGSHVAFLRPIGHKSREWKRLLINGKDSEVYLGLQKNVDFYTFALLVAASHGLKIEKCEDFTGPSIDAYRFTRE